MKLHLIDTDVFIRANREHYGLDYCPVFWDWLVFHGQADNVGSVDAVLKEIRYPVELKQWAHGAAGRCSAWWTPTSWRLRNKLAPDMNTSVSCIAVLREFFNGVEIPFGLSGPSPEYTLAVYHNPLARHRLDPRRMVRSRVAHYGMREDMLAKLQ